MAGETIKELLASGAVVSDRPGSKRLVPAAQSVVVPVSDGCIYCGDRLHITERGNVCRECHERGQDWFHDADMEDR